MLRSYRTVAPIVARRTVLPAQPLALSRRHASQYTDKMLVGSCAATGTCATTIVMFHLLVTPMTATVAAATLATAAASGALCVIDGGAEAGGSSFGAVVGIFMGAMGCYYAKTQNEPWRK